MIGLDILLLCFCARDSSNSRLTPDGNQTQKGNIMLRNDRLMIKEKEVKQNKKS